VTTCTLFLIHFSFSVQYVPVIARCPHYIEEVELLPTIVAYYLGRNFVGVLIRSQSYLLRFWPNSFSQCVASSANLPQRFDPSVAFLRCELLYRLEGVTQNNVDTLDLIPIYKFAAILA
jgi:hypothetical protein